MNGEDTLDLGFNRKDEVALLVFTFFFVHVA